ncbi:MAG: DUF1934 domain-containing protein [Oscillospiraceae bacterium]|nr:DUF1934 domain-containing protein [Oscillospiraceae bacterium]
MDEIIFKALAANAGEAVIEVHNISCIDAPEQETFDFITDGLFSYSPQEIFLSYLETDVTGIPGTVTTIRIRPDEVELSREGAITSTMEFKKGGKDNILYNTPYGTATMGLRTRSITQSFDENGGSLEVDYVLDFEHAMVLHNQINVKVTKQKN